LAVLKLQNLSLSWVSDMRDSRFPFLRPVVEGKTRTFCCHRATLSGRFQPNSLDAITECVRLGAPRLEIDVRFLTDDTMLVFHDERLEGETTGFGSVADIDEGHARRLRYRHDLEARIPFLAEVVDVCQGNATTLQLDLKLSGPMTAVQVDRVATAIKPLGKNVLLGTQAHWNLRPFVRHGIPIAFDPTLHWHYAPGREAALDPARVGLHGLWDDAPLAHMSGVAVLDYLGSRVDDLVALVPAVEWMVDYQTIQYMAAAGFPLGRHLDERRVSLAAWTVNDFGPQETPALLAKLFEAGVSTIITDQPNVLMNYTEALLAAG